MKIAELIREETRQQYFNRLTKSLNIQKLGRGKFATVFQHPAYHNVAVKYVNPVEDPMYIKYIKLCMRHQDNRWLPKIINMEPVSVQDELDVKRHGKGATGTEHGMIIFFQKLRKADKGEIKSAVQEILETLPDNFFSYNLHGLRERNRIFISRSHYSSFGDLLLREWEILAKYSNKQDVKELARILLSVNAEDIHDGNVMMRDEGDKTQLVFTDPVAS